MTDETIRINLHRKTYQLPRLDRADLAFLQNRIQERQRTIKTGKRVRVFWMGLMKKEENLSFEETFQELDRLIGDYEQIIDLFTKHKRNYQKFFFDLTEEIKTVVREKCQQLAEGEAERRSLESTLQTKELKITLKLQKQQIFRTIALLGRTSLFMLDTIETIGESIQKLADDQETQRRVFQEIVARLNEYKRVYELQMKLDRMEHEAIDAVTVGLTLEQFLDPVFGKFQAFIDQVEHLDAHLFDRVSEIEALVHDTLRPETIGILRKEKEDLYYNLLRFLLIGEEKRELGNGIQEPVTTEGWRSSAPDFADGEIDPNLAIARINAYVIGQAGELRKPFQDILHDRDDRDEAIERILIVNRPKPDDREEIPPARYWTENLNNDLTLEMVAIPGGAFLMGSAKEEGEEREYPQHPVTVQPFYMSKYPITQAQWQAIAELPKISLDLPPTPSHFIGDNRPVERVNWFMAVEFCKRLSQLTGRNYHLPGEAQWEYACRATTTTLYSSGGTLTAKAANYGGNRKGTTLVGLFPANDFRLCDMHGNVWEWCEDDWHENYRGAPMDGRPWIDDEDRHLTRKSLRGGSWLNNPINCRSASRVRNFPGYSDFNIGFRVVCPDRGFFPTSF